MLFRNIIFVLIIILFAGLGIALTVDLLANVKKIDKHKDKIRNKSKSSTGLKTKSRKSRFI